LAWHCFDSNPDLDRHQNNADPHYWFKHFTKVAKSK
jgi:hypothetical protein